MPRRSTWLTTSLPPFTAIYHDWATAESFHDITQDDSASLSPTVTFFAHAWRIHPQLWCKPTRCIAARSLLRNYPNAHNFSTLKLRLAGPKFRLGEFQRHFRDFSAIRRLPRTRSYLASWPTLHISRGLRGYTNCVRRRLCAVVRRYPRV